jgi:hypothetical protein
MFLEEFVIVHAKKVCWGATKLENEVNELFAGGQTIRGLETRPLQHGRPMEIRVGE